MDSFEQQTIKQYIYFKNENVFQCLDESVCYDCASVDDVCKHRVYLDQQSRKVFLDLRKGADWSIDQKNLPDTIKNKNRALLNNYAEIDRRIEKTNAALLHVGIKRSKAIQLQKTNEILLRVAIQRSLESTDRIPNSFFPHRHHSSLLYYLYFNSLHFLLGRLSLDFFYYFFQFYDQLSTALQLWSYGHHYYHLFQSIKSSKQ